MCLIDTDQFLHLTLNGDCYPRRIGLLERLLPQQSYPTLEVGSGEGPNVIRPVFLRPVGSEPGAEVLHFLSSLKLRLLLLCQSGKALQT